MNEVRGTKHLVVNKTILYQKCQLQHRPTDMTQGAIITLIFFRKYKISLKVELFFHPFQVLDLSRMYRNLVSVLFLLQADCWTCCNKCAFVWFWLLLMSLGLLHVAELPWNELIQTHRKHAGFCKQHPEIMLNVISSGVQHRLRRKESMCVDIQHIRKKTSTNSEWMFKNKLIPNTFQILFFFPKQHIFQQESCCCW